MSAVAGPTPAQRACGFHDAECGNYEADLALWAAMASDAGGPVVDLGAGTGRVAIPLARGGHVVTAVDLDGDLLDELRRRAAARGVRVATLRADLRTLPPSLGAPRLVIVPMQTIQLLGGPAQRAAFLDSLHAATEGACTLAIAIVPEVEPFDGRGAPDLLLAPDIAALDGYRFESVPRAVLQPEPDAPIAMHRRRSVRLPDGGLEGRPEDVVITLDPVTGPQLLAEATRCGWQHRDTLMVDETDEHAGSVVVTLEREQSR